MHWMQRIHRPTAKSSVLMKGYQRLWTATVAVRMRLTAAFRSPLGLCCRPKTRSVPRGRLHTSAASHQTTKQLQPRVLSECSQRGNRTLLIHGTGPPLNNSTIVERGRAPSARQPVLRKNSKYAGARSLAGDRHPPRLRTGGHPNRQGEADCEHPTPTPNANRPSCCSPT